MTCPHSRPSDLMVGQTLRKTTMFAGVPPDQLQEILSGTRLISAPKGTWLFHEGEPADGFFVVHLGAVSVQRVTTEGKEQVIRVFYPGECFGEVILADAGGYPASAQAVEASQVILVPRSFFRAQIQRSPDLAMRILASMSLHLKYLVETVENLKLTQAEYRIARWLIEQFPASTRSIQDPQSLQLPAAKRLIASQLGVTSETFSRVLARLREGEIIEVDGKNITVLSMERLHDFLLST